MAGRRLEGTRLRIGSAGAWVVVATLVGPGSVPPTVASEPPPLPVPVVAAPPPPPYSLPWQLRPVTVGNVIRPETSIAFYDDNAGNSGSTVATMLAASYKVTAHLAPVVRLGFVRNGAPAATPDGSSVVNPLVGVTYAGKLGGLRAAGFLGGTIPVGMGGGDSPDAAAAAANTAGVSARSAMDNAMFAVNYMTAIVGAGLAYVDHRLTAQVEATVFELFRVRGENSTPANLAATDAARTNSTMGLHLGYFVIPQLSVGGDLRYQRWLSTVTRQNAMGVKSDIPDVNKDTATFAIGPRGHFKLGQSTWIRPGISYSRGLDQPLSSANATRVGNYNMVQVDLPVIF
jgi:hypothetical protein